jgi:hypothetical protein
MTGVRGQPTTVHALPGTSGIDRPSMIHDAFLDT